MRHPGTKNSCQSIFLAARNGVETVQELWPMRYLSKLPVTSSIVGVATCGLTRDHSLPHFGRRAKSWAKSEDAGVSCRQLLDRSAGLRGPDP